MPDPTAYPTAPHAMSTITPKQEQSIADLLATMSLPKGLGTEESACSIAAINLALTGRLTDRIPDCMSPVIGHWIIAAQDAMPFEMRNSAEWKRLLPLAAGSGRDHRQQRLKLILDWMWGTALPVIQPLADRGGFGAEWRTMLERRTPNAAFRAAAVARTRTGITTIGAAAAASLAGSAAETAKTAAAHAASAAAHAAANADQTVRAAATTWDTDAAAQSATWQQFNPCGLLAQLIDVSQHVA